MPSSSPNPTQQWQAYGFALLTVACWATSASAFKISLNWLNPDELLFYASLTSLLLLSVCAVISGKWSYLQALGWGDYGRSALLGLLNPFAYYLVLLRAYDVLPAQQAQPLNFVWPIVLALLATIILRQALTLRTLIAMLISFSGVIWIATLGDPFALQFSNGYGVTLALASTIIWALYWLYGVKDGRDPLVRLCLNFVFGFSYILIFQLVFSDWRWPSLPGIAGAIYVGFFEMGFAFVLWLQALKRAHKASQVSNLIYLTPFCSLVVIHLVLGEPILPSTIIGLILIVTGIALQQRKTAS